MSDTIRRTRVSSLLLPLILLFAGATSVHAAGSSYGKTLVKSFEVPLSEIARFERFNQSPTDANGRPKTSTGLLPDTEDWAGEPVAVSSRQNPYTIVIKTHGIASVDGEAELRWQPGWSNEGMTQSSLSTGVSRKVKANEAIELISVSGPASFKEDRSIAPNIGFVKASNLRIDRVQVEIWSGIGSPGGVGMLFSFQGLLVGLVFLALVLWFRRR